MFGLDQLLLCLLQVVQNATFDRKEIACSHHTCTHLSTPACSPFHLTGSKLCQNQAQGGAPISLSEGRKTGQKIHFQERQRLIITAECCINTYSAKKVSEEETVHNGTPQAASAYYSVTKEGFRVA